MHLDDLARRHLGSHVHWVASPGHIIEYRASKFDNTDFAFSPALPTPTTGTIFGLTSCNLSSLHFPASLQIPRWYLDQYEGLFLSCEMIKVHMSVIERMDRRSAKAVLLTSKIDK